VLPLIAVPQEDRNTCVTSTFASGLRYMLTSGCVFNSQTNVHLIENLTKFPAHIEQYGRDYIGNRANDQSKILQSFCTMLRGKPEFSKYFEITKIDVSMFDIW
jgi:aminoglycoside N3'-acetyltransferase